MIIKLPELISDEGYALQTLGAHTETHFNYTGNKIKALYPIVVNPGELAKFINCHFGSEMTAGAMIVALGAVEIVGGSVQGLQVKAFVLFGSFETLFQGNSDSIIAVQVFGFTLTMTGCSFMMNTNPVGTLLLLGLSGTNPDSSTTIRVEGCTILASLQSPH